jgi:aspartate kinase
MAILKENWSTLTKPTSIVLKEEQILYTFSVKDFSFLNERNLGKIIETFGKYSLRINLMQNTAIQFIVCTDSKIGKNEQILEALSNDFEIEMQKDLKLLSIRHYNQDIIERETKNYNIFLQQKTEKTVQYVIV